ncbi:hypothetical protein BGZ83_007915 [Gryganskiella cystojenkinii]|nr:hypothetical protein BGZ83_007915 [Gryganskiella cystojenkinii]
MMDTSPGDQSYLDHMVEDIQPINFQGGSSSGESSSSLGGVVVVEETPRQEIGSSDTDQQTTTGLPSIQTSAPNFSSTATSSDFDAFLSTTEGHVIEVETPSSPGHIRYKPKTTYKSSSSSSPSPPPPPLRKRPIAPPLKFSPKLEKRSSIISLGFEPCPEIDHEADEFDFDDSQNIHRVKQEILSPIATLDDSGNTSELDVGFRFSSSPLHVEPSKDESVALYTEGSHAVVESHDHDLDHEDEHGHEQSQEGIVLTLQNDNNISPEIQEAFGYRLQDPQAPSLALLPEFADDRDRTEKLSIRAAQELNPNGILLDLTKSKQIDTFLTTEILQQQPQQQQSIHAFPLTAFHHQQQQQQQQQSQVQATYEQVTYPVYNQFARNESYPSAGYHHRQPYYHSQQQQPPQQQSSLPYQQFMARHREQQAARSYPMGGYPYIGWQGTQSKHPADQMAPRDMHMYPQGFARLSSYRASEGSYPGLTPSTSAYYQPALTETARSNSAASVRSTTAVSTKAMARAAAGNSSSSLIRADNSNETSSGAATTAYMDPDPKFCDNCKTMHTPSWRRCPRGVRLLCNACGLYEKLHGKTRPVYIGKDGTIKIQRTALPHAPCFRCNTRDAQSWKRGPNGEIMCNGCYLSRKHLRLEQGASSSSSLPLVVTSEGSSSGRQRRSSSTAGSSKLKRPTEDREDLSADQNPQFTVARSRSSRASRSKTTSQVGHSSESNTQSSTNSAEGGSKMPALMTTASSSHKTWHQEQRQDGPNVVLPTSNELHYNSAIAAGNTQSAPTSNAAVLAGDSLASSPLQGQVPGLTAQSSNRSSQATLEQLRHQRQHQQQQQLLCKAQSTSTGQTNASLPSIQQLQNTQRTHDYSVLPPLQTMHYQQQTIANTATTQALHIQGPLIPAGGTGSTHDFTGNLQHRYQLQQPQQRRRHQQQSWQQQDLNSQLAYQEYQQQQIRLYQEQEHMQMQQQRRQQRVFGQQHFAGFENHARYYPQQGHQHRQLSGHQHFQQHPQAGVSQQQPILRGGEYLQSQQQSAFQMSVSSVKLPPPSYGFLSTGPVELLRNNPIKDISSVPGASTDTNITSITNNGDQGSTSGDSVPQEQKSMSIQEVEAFWNDRFKRPTKEEPPVGDEVPVGDEEGNQLGLLDATSEVLRKDGDLGLATSSQDALNGDDSTMTILRHDEDSGAGPIAPGPNQAAEVPISGHGGKATSSSSVSDTYSSSSTPLTTNRMAGRSSRYKKSASSLSLLAKLSTSSSTTTLQTLITSGTHKVKSSQVAPTVLPVVSSPENKDTQQQQRPVRKSDRQRRKPVSVYTDAVTQEYQPRQSSQPLTTTVPQTGRFRARSPGDRA